MMLSHQILVLKPTAGCVLRHWAARLKQHLLLRIRMCRLCLKRCHNLDSTHQRPPAGCCVFFCFFSHLAVFWRLPATLAGYQPSFGGPVVFRYFSWLVKFHTWMVEFGRWQVNFQSSPPRTWIQWRSYSNHLSTARPNRTDIWGQFVSDVARDECFEAELRFQLHQC